MARRYRETQAEAVRERDAANIRSFAQGVTTEAACLQDGQRLGLPRTGEVLGFERQQWHNNCRRPNARESFTDVGGNGVGALDAPAGDDKVLHTVGGLTEMRFRLVYDGPLATGTSRHSVDNKWAVRRQLAPQLAELWSFKPALLGGADMDVALYGDSQGNVRYLKQTPGKTPQQERRESLLTVIQRGGHAYLPIVRESLHLTCTLDILFLRKDGPGAVISNRGDLDNRIKNLFDALRIPETNEPRPDYIVDSPLHVLAEDDKLITSFAVRTDRLLNRPADAAETVMLIMDVIVMPSRIYAAINSGFAWD